MMRSLHSLTLGALLSVPTLFGLGCGSGGPPELEEFSGLSVSPPNRTVERGDSFQLGATRVDAGRAENVTTSATWSSSDPAIAEVSSTGQVTAKGIGTATITAAAGGASTSTSVYVLGRTVEVQVSPGIIRFPKGTTTTLSTTVISEDHTKRAVSEPGTWSTSSPAVATVSSSGVVTGVAPGTATITFVNRGRTYTQDVTVLDAVLAPELQLSISPTGSIPEGQSAALRVRGTYDITGGGTLANQSVASFVTLSVAEGSEDFISLSGTTVNGLKAGTGTINVKGNDKTPAAGLSGTLTVTVVEAALESLKLVGVPAKASVQGEPISLASAVRGVFGGTERGLTGAFTVTAEPADLVRIIGSTVTPLKAGTVKLTATATVGEVKKSATADLVVADAALTGVAISLPDANPGATLTAGSTSTLPLGATASFGADITQSVTSQVVWLSSDPAVAVVDNAGSAGVVTGLTPGTADIHAYYRGQLVDTQTVTVSAAE